MPRTGPGWLALVAAFAVASVACGVAYAEPHPAPTPKPPERTEPWRETWAGAEAGATYWSAYTATVWAPYGPIIEPGLRLRTGATYSRYRYDGNRILGGLPRPTRYRGLGSSADLMIGYQWQLGTLTTKLYGGIVGVGHTVTPFDAANEMQGYKIGATGALELWWDVRPAIWLSLDITGSTAFDSYGAQARVGWRAMPGLSVGIEGGIAVTSEHDSGRLGAFVRMEWAKHKLGGINIYAGEATLGAGVTGDRDGETNPYARLNVLWRY